jgi:phage shock protein C
MIKRELYRNPKNKRIAGVCSGIADYFGLETWLVRILTVTAFFLMAGPFMFVAYVVAWFIMDERPDHIKVDSENVVDMGGKPTWTNTTGSRVEIKQKVWQAGQPPQKALAEVQGIFADTERRLRDIETYVTSPTFKLDRELGKL